MWPMFVWFGKASTLTSRPTHLAPAAFADEGGDIVRAESGAGSEWHQFWG